MKFIVIGCLTLLEDIEIKGILWLLWPFSFIIFLRVLLFLFYHSVYGCMFYKLLFNFVYNIFLFSCLCILIVMYHSVFIVSTVIRRLP